MKALHLKIKEKQRFELVNEKYYLAGKMDLRS